MNLFKLATQSKWYVGFLQPVVYEVIRTKELTRLLDVGTGYGNLPTMLLEKLPGLKITATDNDIIKINQAIRTSTNMNIDYRHDSNALQMFDAESYDIITFCSILFLLDEQTRQTMLRNAIRVLKPGGKIIVLTPTGDGGMFDAFSESIQHNSSLKELTYLVWRLVTRVGAKKWNSTKWLASQIEKYHTTYSSYTVFNEHAVIEILTKKNI